MAIRPELNFKKQREALQKSASIPIADDLFQQSANAASSLIAGIPVVSRIPSNAIDSDGLKRMLLDNIGDSTNISGITGTETAMLEPYMVTENIRSDNPNFPASLVKTESGGNWAALNDEGYGGRLQFGAKRLADAAKVGLVPQGTDGAAYSKMSPAQQKAVENWHFSDIDKQIASRGLGKYVGQTINGTELTQNSLRAMAHLGGIGGTSKYLNSGGRYNPADSNQTSLAKYARLHR